MTPFVKQPLVAYCHLCGKKLKGKDAHGLKTSRGMHYLKRHCIIVEEIKEENGGIRLLFKPLAVGSTT